MMSPSKWYNKKIFRVPIWAVGLTVLAATAAYAQKQTLQLITYYPAPYAEYMELKVKGKLEVLKRLQAINDSTKVPLDQRGLVVDVADTAHPVQASVVYDLNDQKYGVDLNSTSVLRHLEVANGIKFGGMEAMKSWPVIARSLNYAQSPNAPAMQPNSSMKIYYGTSKTATVALPQAFTATKNNYFVLISPRDLRRDTSLPTHTHLVSANKYIGTSWSTEPASSPTYFTYYEVTNITKSEASFTITFMDGASPGTIPVEFDWIAIGY